MVPGRVALLLLACACVCASSGCRGQTVDARSRFVEDGVQKDADLWLGERIEVDNAGVTPSGGLALTVTGTDRVHATARMLAIANTDDKPNADNAIIAAVDGFVVATTAGVTSVRCAHGKAFGSATEAESGCDALDVTVPAGSADKRLSVVARSGNGKVGVSFDDAQLAELDLHASHGAIDVTVPATQGATITIASETGDTVMLRLPADFAADALTLEAAAGSVDTSAFPGLSAGSTSRGEAGRGAKSISVRAGRIVLAVR